MTMTLYRSCFYLIEKSASTYLQNVPKSYDALRSNSGLFKDRLLTPDKWQKCRGFRERKSAMSPLTPAPQSPLPGSVPMRSLLKPLLFTVGFSTTTFVGCTIWQYENIRSRSKHFSKHEYFVDSWFPEGKKVGDWRQYCNDFWNNLTEAQKVFAPVLFANLLVFAAWRIPRFQPTMMTYFASNPAARIICWPMVLSTFSHFNFLHLAANMYVLHSFCSPVVGSLGKEQAATLYLSAGVIASFASFVHKVVVAQPGLSVGASGAIMAVLGFVCAQYPDAKLSIILLPMFTFTAASAIKVALTFDALGVLLGWKFFDHAAHLGGALTGIAYAYWGNEYVWRKREHILRLWHNFRTAEG